MLLLAEIVYTGNVRRPRPRPRRHFRSSLTSWHDRPRCNEGGKAGTFTQAFRGGLR